VPGNAGRVDLKTVAQTAPFNDPGVHQVADNRYEAVLLAQTFAFTPREIRIPAGARVTFIITSRDVIHGFKVERTDVNMMVVPGQISRASAVFDKPGEYLIVCHEYCGGGHHVMAGKVIVE
jgi:cytochrome c oxidase subunit 2